MFLLRLVLSQSCRLGVLIGTLLMVLLVAAQALKLRAVLIHIADPLAWAKILGLGSLVMAEAVIPIVALSIATVIMAQLRTEGALIGLYSVGVKPSRVFAPSLFIGIMLACCCLFASHITGPHALRALRSQLLTGIHFDLTETSQPIIFPGVGAMARTSAETSLDSFYWGFLRGTEGRDSLIRAKHISGGVDAEGQPFITLEDATVWADGLVLAAHNARVNLDPKPLGQILTMTGPPNALDSSQLEDGNLHHRFTWHKRLIFPVCTALLALFGALLGAGFNPLIAVFVGGCVVGGVHGLMRIGELLARAGEMSPVIGAWMAPGCLGICLTLLGSHVLGQRRYSKDV